MTEPQEGFREVLSSGGHFLRYVEESGELVELSSRGTALLAKQPALIEALLNLNEYRAGEPDPDREQVLENAQRLANLAQREIERDFPLLHAHAIVGIWGALEAWIDEMCIRWIALFPEHCDWGDRRIRVSPNDLLEDDPQAKAFLLLAAIKTDRKAHEKLGVGQFESVMKPLGLDGPVPSPVSDSLFKMQQVRHVYAHRAGVADSVFVERCGTLLECAIGERVIVDGEQMSSFTAATVQYSHILHLRVEDILLGEAVWPDELRA